MLETARYTRKTFDIDAVQVTKDNLVEVAEWCKGNVRTNKDNKKYIKVRVQRPMEDRQTMAFVGDWVLYAGTGYKVYTDKAFKNSFEKIEEEEEKKTA